jgi:hypothetical protein
MSNKGFGTVAKAAARKWGIRNGLVVTLVGGLFLFAFLVIFSRSMLRLLNHDEHYFVSTGYLLRRQGLLPYRDYPYTHMPNLALVYGLVFTLTDHLLFGARMVSVVCSILLVAVLFWLTYRLMQGQRRAVRLSAASGALLLLLANPLFAYTSGIAWNHDIPILSLVLAFSAHIYGTGRNQGEKGEAIPKKARGWNFLSGLLVGLAIGTRLSFGLVLIPFGIALLMMPGVTNWKARLKLIVSFGLGMLLGLLPAIILFGLAPRQFIFGNLGFFDIYAQYRQETGIQARMDLASKLGYLFEQVASQPGNLLLLLCLIFFGISPEVFTRFRRTSSEACPTRYGNGLALMLVLFLTIGGLTPSPVFYQYFYDLVPFAVISVMYGVAWFCSAASPEVPQIPTSEAVVEQSATPGIHSEGTKWALALFLEAALLANLFTFPDYLQLAAASSPANWAPLRVHAMGSAIRSEVPGGTVLTLSPLYPLEGGLRIYPQLVTGPFIWRAAHLVPDKQRRLFGVLAEEDLEGFLVQSPPAGILVGEEKDLEGAFLRYAEQNGYTLIKLPGGLNPESLVQQKLQLWVK